MRVYLDNCCYNRPFDDQAQPSVRLETEAKLLIQTLMRICIGGHEMTNTITESVITDDKLRADGFSVLVKALGDVNAERFIMLMNREPFDYTEWRKDNLFVGETVDSLMDRAESLYGDIYAEKHDQ